MRRIFAKEEVINLLLAEYDYDTDIAVQREESLRIGIERGIQRGIQQGFCDGLHQKALQDAGNFKRLGVSIDIITQATGLSKEEVEKL